VTSIILFASLSLASLAALWLIDRWKERTPKAPGALEKWVAEDLERRINESFDKGWGNPSPHASPQGVSKAVEIAVSGTAVCLPGHRVISGTPIVNPWPSPPKADKACVVYPDNQGRWYVASQEC
jgi:hypothetical protein